MVHSDARLDTHQCEHTPYETLPRSGRVANTPRRSLLVRTPPRPTARSPPCTPFELRPRCAGGVRPGGFFPGGSPSSSPQPRCPAHAQPTGTRQNRHRLMSSSFPRVWLRRAQSDLSAPCPPRSPTFSDQLMGATFEPSGPYLILSSRHSWAMAQQGQQQCTIRSSHGSTCGTTRPVGRCGANHTFNTQQDCRKMRGATRSKAAHLQVVLATDLTAVLRGDEADGARAVGLQAEMRAARAEVAAGHASICLPHDRKGQELRRGLAQPLGYPCPETPCLPSSSR